MSKLKRFNDWESWKLHYAYQLQHPADFERVFVDTVLSKLHNVEPSDVIPQYHFKDSRGGNRYIDFVVMNDAKGFGLAIELDGLTKIQNTWDKSLDYDRYDDMMVRQNDLLKLTNIESLLRFTNKQMFNQTTWVINEINQELQKQAFNTARLREQQTHQVMMLQDYQEQIAQLKLENERISEQAEQLSYVNQTNRDNNEQQAQIANMLAMLQVQMADLQAKIEERKTVEREIENEEPVDLSKPIMPTVTQKDADNWLRCEALRIQEQKQAKKLQMRKKLLPWAVLGVIMAVGWGCAQLFGDIFIEESRYEAGYKNTSGAKSTSYGYSNSDSNSDDDQINDEGILASEHSSSIQESDRVPYNSSYQLESLNQANSSVNTAPLLGAATKKKNEEKISVSSNEIVNHSTQTVQDKSTERAARKERDNAGVVQRQDRDIAINDSSNNGRSWKGDEGGDQEQESVERKDRDR